LQAGKSADKQPTQPFSGNESMKDVQFAESGKPRLKTSFEAGKDWSVGR
jgi:hypothetical protein